MLLVLLSYVLSGAAERFPHCHFSSSHDGCYVAHLHAVHVSQPKDGLLHGRQTLNDTHQAFKAFIGAAIAYIAATVSIAVIAATVSDGFIAATVSDGFPVGNREIANHGGKTVLPAQQADALVANQHRGQGIKGLVQLVDHLPQTQQHVLYHILGIVVAYVATSRGKQSGA